MTVVTRVRRRYFRDPEIPRRSNPRIVPDVGMRSPRPGPPPVLHSRRGVLSPSVRNWEGFGGQRGRFHSKPESILGPRSRARVRREPTTRESDLEVGSTPAPRPGRFKSPVCAPSPTAGPILVARHREFVNHNATITGRGFSPEQFTGGWGLERTPMMKPVRFATTRRDSMAMEPGAIRWHQRSSNQRFSTGRFGVERRLEFGTFDDAIPPPGRGFHYSVRAGGDIGAEPGPHGRLIPRLIASGAWKTRIFE